MSKDTDHAFWAGYTAAIDDAETALRDQQERKDGLAWFLRVRQKFGLPPHRIRHPSMPLDARLQTTQLLEDDLRAKLKEFGMGTDEADEFVTMAARAGRRAGEADRDDI